jgi:hypothetical protein
MASVIGEAVRSLVEEEEKTLTFYAFPVVMHRHIQSTNAIESLAEQCQAARPEKAAHLMCNRFLPLRTLGHRVACFLPSH